MPASKREVEATAECFFNEKTLHEPIKISSENTDTKNVDATQRHPITEIFQGRYRFGSSPLELDKTTPEF
jgi:hypothetical protein